MNAHEARVEPGESYANGRRYESWSARCTSCGTSVGPLTLGEANMWKLGHDRAVETMSVSRGTVTK